MNASILKYFSRRVKPIATIKLRKPRRTVAGWIRVLINERGQIQTNEEGSQLTAE